MTFGPGRYTAHAVVIDQLVNSLANQTVLTGIDRARLPKRHHCSRLFRSNWD